MEEDDLTDGAFIVKCPLLVPTVPLLSLNRPHIVLEKVKTPWYTLPSTKPTECQKAAALAEI